MAIQIVPHGPDLITAAKEFNRRIEAGGATFHVRESPNLVLPKAGPERPYQEAFLAVEGNAIRGGYVLRRTPAVLHGSPLILGGYQIPVSEGTVNNRYGLVGVLMVKDAQQREPMLYMLGMGGVGEPVALLLKKLGFHIAPVPAYYKVLRPARFLRNFRHMRTSILKRVAFDAAAFSGAAWTASKLANAFYLRCKPLDPTLSVSVVERFSREADDLWKRGKDAYLMSAVRNSETLNALYPASEKRFVRMVVSQGGRCLGWAVVVDNTMSNHYRFGDMRLSAIGDCFAAPGDASHVMLAVTTELQRRGTDLIVTNQSHAAWQQGLRDAGYFQGPTNFVLGVSKTLKGLMDQNPWRLQDLHLNRGDSYGGAMDPDVWADWGAVWRLEDCFPFLEPTPPPANPTVPETAPAAIH